MTGALIPLLGKQSEGHFKAVVIREKPALQNILYRLKALVVVVENVAAIPRAELHYSEICFTEKRQLYSVKLGRI